MTSMSTAYGKLALRFSIKYFQLNDGQRFKVLRRCQPFSLKILKNILQKIVVKLIEAEKILFKCNSARKKEMETKERKNNKADFPHFSE